MKFDFCKEEYDLFVEHCGFTDEELAVLSYKRRGWQNLAVADELHMSESTVKRRCCKIQKKILKFILTHK